MSTDNEDNVSTDNIENYYEEVIDISNPVNNSNNVAQVETEPTVTTRTDCTNNRPIRLITNMLQETDVDFENFTKGWYW